MVKIGPRRNDTCKIDRIIRAALEKRPYWFAEFKLNIDALKTSISHLEKKIEESKNGNLSLRNAVSIALDIEKSMIDNKFFEIFDLVCTKQERIRLGLEKATLKHRQHLEKLFSELNKN